MAKQVTVRMIDDFDGESDAAETVNFSIDGHNYEIDLSMLNASKLRGQLEEWTHKARKVGGRRRKTPGSKTPVAAVKAAAEHAISPAAIREWAGRNGHEVSARGRISQDVVDAYHKAAS